MLGSLAPLYVGLGYGFFNPMYFVFLAPALIFALWAQGRVRSAYTRFSRVIGSSNLTGAEAAATMLRGKGMEIAPTPEAAKRLGNAVAIARIGGVLTDHYDPRAHVLRLSPQVYDGRSLASVGVACHEAGHALQHAEHYAPLELRNVMVPVASFGSWVAVPLIFLGFIIGLTGLIWVGVIGFSAIVLFQLITLPVEFDASRRAKLALAQTGIIRGPAETQGVASVLDAAALTYVAAVVSSLLTLAYYLFILSGSRR
jgi:Zn-dependent membrane protease YugP